MCWRRCAAACACRRGAPAFRSEAPARRSVPQKVDAAQLVAEARAGIDRGVELLLAQHISLDRRGGDHAGVARLAAHQRQFAEKLAGAEPGDLAVAALD